MIEKYAVIEDETIYIINLIMWDGISPYETKSGTTLKLFSSLSEEEIMYPPV